MTEEQDIAQESWGEFRSMVSGPNARPSKARTPEGRAKYEDHGRKPRGRKPGKRTLKMTLKVDPDFRRKLETMADARGVAMAEVLELALEALEARRA